LADLGSLVVPPAKPPHIAALRPLMTGLIRNFRKLLASLLPVTFEHGIDVVDRVVNTGFSRQTLGSLHHAQ
jgi:hypothetical protein